MRVALLAAALLRTTALQRKPIQVVVDVDDTVKVAGLPALEGVEYRDHADQAVIAILAGEEEEAKPGDDEAAAPAAAE